MRGWIGQGCLGGCVLREAITELLEIEDATGLIHSLSRTLDRRQEREHARNEDAGGYGEVSLSENGVQDDTVKA